MDRKPDQKGRFIFIACPYLDCGYENNKIYMTSYYSEKRVITCDSEAGGCDQDFVAYVSLRPVIHTSRLEEVSESIKQDT